MVRSYLTRIPYPTTRAHAQLNSRTGTPVDINKMDEIVFEEPVVYNSDNSATQSAINAVGRLLLLVAKKLEIPDTEINTAMGN